MFVYECMNRKFSVLKPNSTFREALLLFRREKTGILPIINEDHTLCAAISQYSLFQALLDDHSLDDVITPYTIHDVVTVYADDTITNARDFLLQKQVIHAIVISQDHQVCGILGRADLMRTSRLMIQKSRRRNATLTNSLQSLIQHLPTGIVAVDKKGAIQVMNRAAEKMFALSESNCLGQSLSTVLPELDEVLELNGEMPYQKIALKGNELLVNAKTFSEDEHLWGSLVILQHFTDYEKVANELASTKELKQTLQTVVDTAYDGLILIDEKADIQMINDAICQLGNYSKDELIGQPVDRFFPELKLTETLDNGIQKSNIEAIIMGEHRTLVSKIPIIQNEQTVGVIANMTYRNLNKWKDVIQNLDHLKKEVSYYRGELSRLEGTPFDLDDILTQNEEMIQLIRTARQAASGFSNVLLLGESGTGKELFARGIHTASKRSGRLVSINCAAVPFDLWESKIFGYEEGAFTSAKRGGKPGKFELAHNGTLFLDEIGDMPLDMQVKLLRVLQEREFERIGGTKTIQANVRIIAATNKNLAQMVADGTFREDLFYRLNVIPLRIPPLRRRKDDIPILAMAIGKKFSHLMDTGPIAMNEDVFTLLCSHHWPGNVRELENVIERAMNVMAGNLLTADHFPDYPGEGEKSHDEQQLIPPFPQDGFHVGKKKNKEAGVNYKNKVQAAEKEAIALALQATGGNRTAAAKSLGISRSQLYKKLNQYSIT